MLWGDDLDLELDRVITDLEKHPRQYPPDTWNYKRYSIIRPALIKAGRLLLLDQHESTDRAWQVIMTMKRDVDRARRLRNTKMRRVK